MRSGVIERDMGVWRAAEQAARSDIGAGVRLERAEVELEVESKGGPDVKSIGGEKIIGRVAEK